MKPHKIATPFVVLHQQSDVLVRLRVEEEKRMRAREAAPPAAVLNGARLVHSALAKLVLVDINHADDTLFSAGGVRRRVHLYRRARCFGVAASDQERKTSLLLHRQPHALQVFRGKEGPKASALCLSSPRQARAPLQRLRPHPRITISLSLPRHFERHPSHLYNTRVCNTYRTGVNVKAQLHVSVI